MDNVISLLLNAARAAIDLGGARAVVPRRDIFDASLAALPLDSSARERLLASATAGSATELLVEVLDNARAIAAQEKNPARVEDSHFINQHLTTLFALTILAERGVSCHGTVSIDSLDLLSYFEQLHFPGGGIPRTIVVGLGGRRDEVTIRLPDVGYVAQRMMIIYPGGAVHPRLRLTTPSMIADDERPRLRATWVQKPHAAYDLDLYTYKDRLVGRVNTRMSDTLPSSLDQPLHLAVAPTVPVQYLVTDIFEVHDRANTHESVDVPLARCIKIIDTSVPHGGVTA
jgi:hypothetical protein